MAKACTVFISSTAEDLKDHRLAARDAALAVGLRPVMMEYLAASGGPPLTECLSRVSPCDLVVALVAQRHGWTPPDQLAPAEKSITRLECEHAAGLSPGQSAGQGDLEAAATDIRAVYVPERERGLNAARCCAAARGTTKQRICGRWCATGTILITGTTTSGFELFRDVERGRIRGSARRSRGHQGCCGSAVPLPDRAPGAGG